MSDDQLTELAKMFKDREQKIPPSMTTGIVISPPPNVQIRLNDVIVLYKHKLVIASSMLTEYNRLATIDGTQVQITMKDTIKPGDEVILMPVMDGQLYFVLDKAVRF
ncbi:DUF2577 family protein [Peribacillus loiseleuriae]|uniref:DUF2577 family protein n=1 Tax=Peribacillus loiseleuriae TaxID=1679170 RepID=UPI003D032802